MSDTDFFLDTGLPIILNSVGFVTAMLAALFWYQSAKAEVPFDHNEIDRNGMHAGGIIIEHKDGRQIDPFASAARANVLNARAAICAAIAAASQASVYFFPARNVIISTATDLWRQLVACVPFF
ncbi:hypothetical protein HFC70_23525 [Agrobacterium sp. a22-2]|uniref:hypothetical protein n=1 Tax=Agrobacterium sp. a22-2 TaxID=2283840 RepID=UPI0014472504|nr:hypothetical protein [Agrobacterium sp. a22-2]NKN39319.1 hypothetical protein [Agrobacterium sp. a22-2]